MILLNNAVRRRCTIGVSGRLGWSPEQRATHWRPHHKTEQARRTYWPGVQGRETVSFQAHFKLNSITLVYSTRLTPLGKAEKEEIKRFFDSLYPFVPEFPFMGQMMAELQIQKLHSWSDNEVCQILKPISHTKLVSWMEDIDKKQNDTEEIRDQFMTALSEASLPETNVTFPEFLWYLWQPFYVWFSVDLWFTVWSTSIWIGL